MSTEPSVKVEEQTSDVPNEKIWGSFKVKRAEGHQLELMGWALGTGAEVEVIEIVASGTVVATTKPSLPRAEVAEEHPNRKSAATCGFEVAMEAKGKGQSTLELRAVLDDGTLAPIGQLRVLAPPRRWPSLFGHRA